LSWGLAALSGIDDFIHRLGRHAFLAAGARPLAQMGAPNTRQWGEGGGGRTGWSGTFWFWEGDLRSHSSSLSLLRVVRVLVAADSDLTTGTRAGSPPTRI